MMRALVVSAFGHFSPGETAKKGHYVSTTPYSPQLSR